MPSELSSHTPLQQPTNWPWPQDDQQPVDLSRFALSTYPHRGDSRITVARRNETPCGAKQRPCSAPPTYFVKLGRDAVAERCYYLLARTLALPQQHVWWAIPPHRSHIAAAIQIESQARFPDHIDSEAGTMTVMQRVIPVVHAQDFVRHTVPHFFCGSVDGTNCMVRGQVLFGIDAAACQYQPLDSTFFTMILDLYHKDAPAKERVARDMLARLAAVPDIAAIIEQDIAASPFPLSHLHPFASWGHYLEGNQAALRQLLSQ
jgi:hypothetical protein